MNDGHPFNKTTLYKILTNRVYLGEIRHKDKWYHGEHQAIIDRDLWDKAHTTMAQDRTQRARYRPADRGSTQRTPLWR